MEKKQTFFYDFRAKFEIHKFKDRFFVVDKVTGHQISDLLQNISKAETFARKRLPCYRYQYVQCFQCEKCINHICTA
jgi:hypothetical protein